MTRIWLPLLLAAMAAALEQTPGQQLDQVLMKSDQGKVMGDLAGAIKGYESALAQVKSEPSLKNREEEVLQRLVGAYIAAQRYPDAVRVSRRILMFHEADCKPDATWIERCADSQYGLGLAMMHAGDFAGATTELTASVASSSSVG